MCSVYSVYNKGEKLNGANRYTLHFRAGQLPPVNSFWSLTMYDLPASLLVDNPINRYLLNPAMLPQFVKDTDGGITFYIQNESPGRDKKQGNRIWSFAVFRSESSVNEAAIFTVLSSKNNSFFSERGSAVPKAIALGQKGELAACAHGSVLGHPAPVLAQGKSTER